MTFEDIQKKFIEEEIEAYRELVPEEPVEVVPRHDRMTSKEVCEELRWSMSKLRRNVKERKLAYFKEDGKLYYKRADVERYKHRRYVPSK